MRNVFLYVTLILFLSGCSSVFEKSIAEESIEIYTPADSFNTKKYSQQFYWEKVTGATSYRLQIAQPSFTSGMLQSIILDSITTSNSVTFTLSPGEYEWRLRAQNGGSETPYYTRKLFIKETTFNERPMSVKSPSSSATIKYVTYESGIAFEWYAVTGAENYIIEIDTLSKNFTNPVVTTTVDGSQLIAKPSLPKRGQYKWRMYADSAGIKSAYSFTGTIDFRLDTARLSAPGNNAKDISQNAEFTWGKPSNGLSTDTYKYRFYLLNSLNESDNATVANYSFPLNVTTAGETQQIIGLTRGKTYYWGISVIDQYGVESQITSKRKFTVSN